MAVPARKTSKSKKRKRRTAHGLALPSLSWDAKTGTYYHSHHLPNKASVATKN